MNLRKELQHLSKRDLQLIYVNIRLRKIRANIKKRHVRYMAFFVFIFLQFSSMLIGAEQINNEKAVYAAFLMTGYVIVLFMYAAELLIEKRKQTVKVHWV